MFHVRSHIVVQQIQSAVVPRIKVVLRLRETAMFQACRYLEQITLLYLLLGPPRLFKAAKHAREVFRLRTAHVLIYLHRFEAILGVGLGRRLRQS